MTAPRRIIPSSTVMITRRCLDRRFLLRPSVPTNELFQYILAVAARKYGVQLHALCVMSNHFHLVLTDVQGTLPAFEQYLDSLVARSLNALHGRWDYFWSAGSYSCVTLADRSDVLDKIAYVLVNPVHAGLVRAGAQWPGLWTSPESIGSSAIRVRRPQHFFREGGPMPDEVPLEFVTPPGFASREEFCATLRAACSTREEQAIRAIEARGLSFLGRHRILAQSVENRPATKEQRRELDPTVACRDPWRRVEMLQRLTGFRGAYRRAWEAFSRGARDALFPYGTYWMRVAYGACCATS